MQCWCCENESDLARRVKLRPWREFEAHRRLRRRRRGLWVLRQGNDLPLGLHLPGLLRPARQRGGSGLHRPARVQPGRRFPKRPGARGEPGQV
jgi:hypothetical protein